MTDTGEVAQVAEAKRIYDAISGVLEGHALRLCMMALVQQFENGLEDLDARDPTYAKHLRDGLWSRLNHRRGAL